MISWEHKDLWVHMDNFKDKQIIDDIYSRGNPPWEVWQKKDVNGKKISTTNNWKK